MDMLGHINNVVYVDYLQEARIDMFAVHAGFSGADELAEGVVVVRHEVEFVRPLVYREAPVRIDLWVTEVRASRFTLAYEIYDETDEGRIVYLRASSVLAPYVFANEAPRRLSPTEREILGRFLEPAEPRAILPGDGSSRHVHPMRVRFSDVDVYRHVNNVKYFEYFQEARIAYVYGLFGGRGRGKWGDHVVARTDIDYYAPILFRLEPYDVHSWISRVGDRSLTIAAEIRDGDKVLARGSVVMVTFDSKTQRSAPMSQNEREVLSAELGG
jgi:acyl-CoA thioester hydrolase